MIEFRQTEFNESIGRLDRILSLLLIWSSPEFVVIYEGKTVVLDGANIQTLKHHAEDMIGVGQKILKQLENA